MGHPKGCSWGTIPQNANHHLSFPHWLAQFSVRSWYLCTFGIQGAGRRLSKFFFSRPFLFSLWMLGSFFAGREQFRLVGASLLDHDSLSDPSLSIAFLALACLAWTTLFAIFLSREWPHFFRVQSAPALNLSMRSPPDCVRQRLLL